MRDKRSSFIDFYSASTWLLIIRSIDTRVLKEACGYDAGEELNLFRIAEQVIGTAPQEEMIETVPVAYDIRVASRVAKLLIYCDMIGWIEGNLQSAVKGVKYRQGPEKFAVPTRSEVLIEALQEYDLRNSWPSIERWTEVVESSHLTRDSADPSMLIANRYTHGAVEGQSWAGALAESSRFRARHKFTVRTFNTGDPNHPVLIAGSLRGFASPEQAASLVILGNALLQLAIEGGHSAGLTIAERGIVALPNLALAALLTRTIADSAMSAWLEQHGLSDMTSAKVRDSVDRLYAPEGLGAPGKVLYGDESNSIIDAVSFTWHVFVTLKINPRLGGAVVNGAAFDFEATAQALIDETELKPPSPLREFRGRKLRRNGEDITDIDALAVSDGLLVLISCKQVTLTAEYSAGEYSAVRNARTRVDDALRQWKAKVEYLSLHPVGDNYDFSEYRLDGFVLVPSLVFTPLESSRRILKFGHKGLFFTGLESIDQFAATLEMTKW